MTSMVYRDGTDVPHNLAMGTYVVFEAAEDNGTAAGASKSIIFCLIKRAVMPLFTGRST